MTGTDVVVVGASTTVDTVVVLAATVVLVVVLVDVVVVEPPVVDVVAPVTVKVVLLVCPFGLVALTAAAPGSAQLVFAWGVQADGALTVADPEPLATAMLFVREP